MQRTSAQIYQAEVLQAKNQRHHAIGATRMPQKGLIMKLVSISYASRISAKTVNTLDGFIFPGD
jgi:uncharacterized protein YqeY